VVPEYVCKDIHQMAIAVATSSPTECRGWFGQPARLQDVVDGVMSDHCFTMKLLMLWLAADSLSTFSRKTWPAWPGLWWCEFGLGSEEIQSASSIISFLQSV